MQTAMGFDANGRKYVVYRVKLDNAYYIDIDADLADASGNPEAFVQVHVDMHKKELGLR